MSDELRNDIKELTQEMHETNKLLVRIATDNEHRDTRAEKAEENIESILKVIGEYQPTWNRSRKDHDSKDGYIRNIIWVCIVLFALLVMDAFYAGKVKLPFQGDRMPTKATQERAIQNADNYQKVP